MDPTQKQLLIEVVAKIIQFLDQADEDGNLRQVMYQIESLLANEYGIPPDEIKPQIQPDKAEAGKMVFCFVCSTEVPQNTAEKVELAAGIGGHLCERCNQLRLSARTDSREYAQLTDEQKNLLKLFQ